MGISQIWIVDSFLADTGGGAYPPSQRLTGYGRFMSRNWVTPRIAWVETPHALVV
ncbi:hypothetical protein GGD46_005930 [Rhizobium lusitanum]|uniref:Uncharacterized protein n=1 Tax=Rhizobium lusitanum TaxID=293958 RepID=A0A7X0IWR2_9HYPH|nr:hypothetical protein [Rhizobium lusitanum]